MRMPESLKTLVLVLVLAAIAGCFLGACSADVSAPIQSCANELRPPTFRLVLTTGDTLPRVTNRYLIPLRSVDTVRAELYDHSGTITIPFVHGAGYCVTALDSASARTRGVLGWVE